MDYHRRWFSKKIQKKKKQKQETKQIQSPKKMQRLWKSILLVGRRFGARTCCRYGKSGHASELEARKTGSNNAAEQTAKRTHQRQTGTPLALSLSLSLCSEGNLRREDPVSILGPGDWRPVATTSELSLHVLYIFVIFRPNFCVVTRKNGIFHYSWRFFF